MKTTFLIYLFSLLLIIGCDEDPPKPEGGSTLLNPVSYDIEVLEGSWRPVDEATYNKNELTEETAYVLSNIHLYISYSKTFCSLGSQKFHCNNRLWKKGYEQLYINLDNGEITDAMTVMIHQADIASFMNNGLLDMYFLIPSHCFDPSAPAGKCEILKMRMER